MERLDRRTITTAFAALNDRLAKQGINGEICIFGGGTMVLAFNARLSTHDVDAVFRPAEPIREAARAIAEDLGLKPDWLNDGVKGFLSPKGILVPTGMPQFSNLRLSRPNKKYLLAMKCLAARVAGYEIQGDKADVLFLVGALGLKAPEEVLAIVESFYPPQQIPTKTRFFVEEVMHEWRRDQEGPSR